jgi:hypothetical protein
MYLRFYTRSGPTLRLLKVGGLLAGSFFQFNPSMT